jgi:hypothetical protein
LAWKTGLNLADFGYLRQAHWFEGDFKLAKGAGLNCSIPAILLGCRRPAPAMNRRHENAGAYLLK